MKYKSRIILFFSILSIVIVSESCCDSDINLEKELRAKFEFNTSTLNTSLATTFSDVSSGNVTRRKWQFSGANISISVEENPIITFLDTGAIDIKLIVFDDDNDSSDTSSQFYYVFPGNGLVAYYPLDSMTMDMSGNEYHGTMTGTSLQEDVNGNINSARLFYDNNDYIRCSPNIGEHLSEGTTFSAWIKALDTIVAGSILSNMTLGIPSKIGPGFNLTYSDDDDIGVVFSYSTSENKGVHYRTGSHQQFSPNVWAHILGTWNGEISPMDWDLKIFINGLAAHSSGGASNVINEDFYENSKDSLFIGSKNFYRIFNCVIDEVRIYDRPLSLDEIQLLHKYRK